MYKNILAAAALALTAGLASAAGTSVGVDYDIESAGHNANGYKTQQELKGYVAQETKIGTFDAGLIGLRFQGIGHDNANGAEVGYSNGITYGQYGLSGRVGIGRLNNIDVNGGGFTDSSKYYTASIEGTVPVTTRFNAFVGFRHRDGLGDGNAYAMNNRGTFGLDYAFDKHVTARLGYAHTTQAGMHLNGATAALAYAF